MVQGLVLRFNFTQLVWLAYDFLGLYFHAGESNRPANRQISQVVPDKGIWWL